MKSSASRCGIHFLAHTFLYPLLFLLFMEKPLQILSRNKLVESIIQFGSSLHSKKPRDIDLCLFTTKPLALKERLKLQRHLPEKYDINYYDTLPLNIKKRVLSEGKILFTRDYYHVLKQLQYVDLEYPRYAQFLEEYHKQRMAAL